jgi:HPt (histidine-containing phosphotransfer) domain-containing protein
LAAAARKSAESPSGIYRILGRARAHSDRCRASGADRETSMALSASESMASESSAAIDRRHLARMTLGDRSLEQEVLQLFDRQASLLIKRMRNVDRAGDGAAIGALAHTLKGSAAGIGAGEVARAAEAAERAAVLAPADLSATIDRLAQAVDEARVLIAALLRQG